MVDAIHGLAGHLFAVGQSDMIGGKPPKPWAGLRVFVRLITALIFANTAC